MKKLLFVMALVCAWALAQTTIPLSSIRALGNGSVLVLVNNTLRMASLDGLTVDTTGNPVLRVTATFWQRADYRVDGVLAEFGVEPHSTLLVYKNGLLLSPEVDYTVSGSVIRLVPNGATQPGDVVILRWLP